MRLWHTWYIKPTWKPSLSWVVSAAWIFDMPRGINLVALWRWGIRGVEWSRFQRECMPSNSILVSWTLLVLVMCVCVNVPFLLSYFRSIRMCKLCELLLFELIIDHVWSRTTCVSSFQHSHYKMWRVRSWGIKAYAS